MDVHERLAKFLPQTPEIAAAAFVAPNATVIGDVVLGSSSSVFYGAVLRGDINGIRVGEGTNLQDQVVVHVADARGTVLGAWCTVGHAALVHACTVGDECLVGMGAVLLDGVRIGNRSVVGANSLVPAGMVVPPGSLVYGTPARVIRELTPKEQEGIRGWAEKYVVVARAHAARATEMDDQ